MVEETSSYIIEINVYGCKICVKSPVNREIFMNNVYEKSSSTIGTGWFDFEDVSDGEIVSIRLRDISVAKDVTKSYSSAKKKSK